MSIRLLLYAILCGWLGGALNIFFGGDSIAAPLRNSFFWAVMVGSLFGVGLYAGVERIANPHRSKR